MKLPKNFRIIVPKTKVLKFSAVKLSTQLGSKLGTIKFGYGASYYSRRFSPIENEYRLAEIRGLSEYAKEVEFIFERQNNEHDR
jgi:hypothetical protein